jgi:hypothetical protein
LFRQAVYEVPKLNFTKSRQGCLDIKGAKFKLQALAGLKLFLKVALEGVWNDLLLLFLGVILR